MPCEGGKGESTNVWDCWFLSSACGILVAILQIKANLGRLARVRDLQSQATTFKILALFVACFLQCGAKMPQTTDNSGTSSAPSTSKSNNKANSIPKSAVDTSIAPPTAPIKAPPAPPQPTDGFEVVQLETAAYDFESLGFKINLPKGSLVAKDSVNNAISWMVADERNPTRWLFRVQAVKSNDPQSDTESQMRNHLQSFKAAGNEFTLLSDRPTKICGLPARFFWLSTPTGDIRAISGWFILQTGIGEFMVFSILTTEKDFAYAEAVIDTAVVTIDIRDMSAVQKERADRLQAGADFLKSITPERLKTIADGKKRLYRSWVETPEGDVEQGWVSIEIKAGPRGMTDPSADSKTYTESAKEQGFLISIDSRSIEGDGLNLTNARCRYWLAWDLASEAWSVRSVPQIPGPKNIFSQTGVRLRVSSTIAGTDLAVLTSAQGMESEPLSWTIPSTSYLPHPLSFIFGEIVQRQADTPHHFALWSFDPNTGKISQRTFKWRADAAHPGHWLLETQTSFDAPPSTDEIDAQGHLVLRSFTNGTRMGPTTLAEIERLWKAKGLQP